MSIFNRKKNNFAALDGLRAWAISWVFLCHIGDVASPWYPCIFNDHKDSVLLRTFLNGEMGVDLFFILSGFLIANILLKEADKNDGHINYSKFLIGRVTRLIFVIIP